jgi:hypothetical protein
MVSIAHALLIARESKSVTNRDVGSSLSRPQAQWFPYNMRAAAANALLKLRLGASLAGCRRDFGVSPASTMKPVLAGGLAAL